VIALFLLGGAVIHSFAFALLMGFTVGTYSSIYIAAPIVLWLERWWRRPGGGGRK
jgi:preprotein translocase subunit SecF